MTRDWITPTSVAIRARCRQIVIWSSIAIFIAIYFISSRIHARVGGGHRSGSTDLLEVALLLAWTVAASGYRPAIPGLTIPGPAQSLRVLPDVGVGNSLLRVGTAVVDAVVVAAGTLLVSVTCGFAPGAAREVALLVVVAALIGTSTSLQYEIIRLFANRAIALVMTALVTASALHLVRSTGAPPLVLLGRLGFPVRALVSATEEPLRLDLAARALAAGVAYDLALAATLFALPGHRARG